VFIGSRKATCAVIGGFTKLNLEILPVLGASQSRRLFRSSCVGRSSLRFVQRQIQTSPLSFNISHTVNNSFKIMNSNYSIMPLILPLRFKIRSNCAFEKLGRHGDASVEPLNPKQPENKSLAHFATLDPGSCIDIPATYARSRSCLQNFPDRKSP